MPRDNLCLSCGGMYHDDQMDEGLTCIYCAMGVDSDVQEPTTPERRGEGGDDT